MTWGVLRASAAALACFAVGAIAAPAQACVDADLDAQLLTAKRYEASVLCLVNQVRAAAGAPPVRPEGRLRRAASRHTRSMVSGSFFSHRDPGGRNPGDRIDETGYTSGAARWMVGENIAWGAGILSSPRSIVGGWFASPAHRATMLTPAFRDVGMAATMAMPTADSAPSPVTLTADFGLREGKG